MGYTLTDDDWLEIDESEVRVVQNLFETFLEVEIEGAYSTTADRVERSDDDIRSSTIKPLPKKSVYIGEPSVGATSTDASDEESGTVLECDAKMVKNGQRTLTDGRVHNDDRSLVLHHRGCRWFRRITLWRAFLFCSR